MGYQYAALVDDVRTPLQAAQCAAAAGGSGYDCRTPLPRMTAGRHVLALLAIDAAGLESGVSAPLTLEVRPASSALAPVGSAADPGSRDTAAPPWANGETVCTESAAPQCFQVETVVDNLPDGPRRLRALPDGRLLFLEGDARVLLLGNGRLAMALQLPQDLASEMRLTDIAPAPDFATTRFVYATLVRTERGEPVTDVVRFRELGDRLGEGATIVPGVRMGNGVEPALAVIGPHVYLAVAEPGAGSAGAGAVLRFTRDGAAAGRTAGSPQWVETPQALSSLAANSSLLWAANAGGGLVAIDLEAERQLPGVRSVAVDGDWPAGTKALRDLSWAATGAEATATLVAAGGEPSVLIGVANAQAAMTGAGTLPVGGETLTGLAAADGRLYLGLAAGDGQAGFGRLLRLTPSLPPQ
jgi:hypothetical protein